MWDLRRRTNGKYPSDNTDTPTKYRSVAPQAVEQPGCAWGVPQLIGRAPRPGAGLALKAQRDALTNDRSVALKAAVRLR
jgi:hypothetical protein